MPKAYLNILFFDEQFKFVEQNSEIIQVTTKGSGQQVVRMDGSAKQAPKNGFVYIYVSNESNNLVYFDNLQVVHERSSLIEENHYYPFGLIQSGISSKALLFGSPQNKLKYNGKEVQQGEFSNNSGIEYLDYGARYYDMQIGKFVTQDRFSLKYEFITPYQYAVNNPILYIDVKGDSINVSSIRQDNPEETQKIVDDLMEQTGLNISIDENGFLNYQKPQGKLGGSKTARKFLMKAIDNKRTVNVVPGESNHVDMDNKDIGKRNEVNINFKDIRNSIDGTSDDLNSKTLGYGMTFLHELGHTQVGGSKLDFVYGDENLLGANVNRLNKIRKELGVEYGQEVIFRAFSVPSEQNHIYFPYSQSALEQLRNGEKPTSGFIKMPRN